MRRLFRRDLTTIRGQIPAGIEFEVWADNHMTATTSYTTQRPVNFEASIDDKGRIKKFNCDDSQFPIYELTQRSQQFIIDNI